MSNIAFLAVPSETEALMNRRAQATEGCFRLIRSGSNSLHLFPSRLIEAFEVEAWKEHLSPNKAVVQCADFMEWVVAPFPRGIESDPDTVELILSNAKDQATAMKAKLLFEQNRIRRPGGANNPLGSNQHVIKEVNVDNIHVDQEGRPSGTSTAAGLRKLQKAAAEGNADAATQLAEVVAGNKKVHAACVEAGLRKPTKLDADVRARCSRSVAEWIVSRLGQDDPSPIVSDLFALGGGAKHVAIKIKNLVGEASVMDRAGWRP